ncbi:MAG TPA: DUF4339 domain-containing protein [Candidatus Methylacidiphilales bacterium]|nr:DUF4339 domain-containing protein [Candidatus Methylacidiphilales bacterium]
MDTSTLDYLIHEKGEQQGPYSLEQVQEMWNSGSLGPEAYYWTEGMAEWASLAKLVTESASVPELALLTEPASVAEPDPVTPPAPVIESASVRKTSAKIGASPSQLREAKKDAASRHGKHKTAKTTQAPMSASRTIASIIIFSLAFILPVVAWALSLERTQTGYQSIDKTLVGALNVDVIATSPHELKEVSGSFKWRFFVWNILGGNTSFHDNDSFDQMLQKTGLAPNTVKNLRLLFDISHPTLFQIFVILLVTASIVHWVPLPKRAHSA